MWSLQEASGRAALLHGDGVAVAYLLRVFARSLREEGVLVDGFVEEPLTEPGCGPVTLRHLSDIGQGGLVPLCHARGLVCEPEAHLPAAVVSRFADLAEGRRAADLVVASGYFRSQRDEWWRALDGLVARGVPVLTAVRRHEAEAWLALGNGTLLEANLGVLRDWWKRVALRRDLLQLPQARPNQ